MTLDIHLSKTEWSLASLIFFGLLWLLSWRLTRYSADFPPSLVALLCAIGQIILIFGFTAKGPISLALAFLFQLWVTWTLIGCMTEVDRSARVILSIASPVIALLSIFSVYAMTH